MKRSAFTLVELLVIIAIIAVLIGLLLPAVMKVRAAANRTYCQNNLKQIGLAFHLYHDANDAFTPGFTAWNSPDPTATSPGWGWPAYLLPYLDQGPVFQQIRFDLPISYHANAAPRMTRITMFLCPADPEIPINVFWVDLGDGGPPVAVAPLSYAGCWGATDVQDASASTEGVLYRNSRVRLTDITDGTSQTTMVGDRAWSHAMAPWAGSVPGGLLLPGPLNPWQNTSPAVAPATQLVLAHNRSINDTTDRDGGLDDYFGYHPGGVNMLFADGWVHFLNSNIDRAVFRALGTRAGGEVVDSGEY
jgi:prepilin-type processing-associated H-X9-DG protein